MTPLSPTVFGLQWPKAIQGDIDSEENSTDSIINSDLELAVLVLLFLIVQAVTGSLRDKHVVLYSDNSPSEHWVQQLAAKNSTAAMQLIRALSLNLQITKASPLMTLHITDSSHVMMDMLSQSFGSPS